MNVDTIPLRGPIRRILVLRPRALGDVLLVTPALRALRAGFPKAELHFGVDETLAPLVRRNPHVDRLWLLPCHDRRKRRLVALAWSLSRAGFDLVLDLHGSPRTALLTRATGALNRVGYALRGRGRLYNHTLLRDSDRSGQRRVVYAARTSLEVVARLGVETPELDDTTLVFPPEPQAEKRIETVLADLVPSRPRVGLLAPGTWPSKTWPVPSYAALADRLTRAGCTIVLLWGPGEREVSLAVRAAMQEQAVLLPPTDIDEMAAVVARLDLLVSNDSGVKHVAVARGTRTLTVFGPTRARSWTPDSPRHAVVSARLPCLGCNLTHCSHNLCMQLLHPRTVAERALQLLGDSGSGVHLECVS